jgi:hypothetical protein
MYTQATYSPKIELRVLVDGADGRPQEEWLLDTDALYQPSSEHNFISNHLADKIPSLKIYESADGQYVKLSYIYKKAQTKGYDCKYESKFYITESPSRGFDVVFGPHDTSCFDGSNETSIDPFGKAVQDGLLKKRPSWKKVLPKSADSRGKKSRRPSLADSLLQPGSTAAAVREQDNPKQGAHKEGEDYARELRDHPVEAVSTTEKDTCDVKPSAETALSESALRSRQLHVHDNFGSQQERSSGLGYEGIPAAKEEFTEVPAYHQHEDRTQHKSTQLSPTSSVVNPQVRPEEMHFEIQSTAPPDPHSNPQMLPKDHSSHCAVTTEPILGIILSGTRPDLTELGSGSAVLRNQAAGNVLQEELQLPNVVNPDGNPEKNFTSLDLHEDALARTMHPYSPSREDGQLSLESDDRLPPISLDSTELLVQSDHSSMPLMRFLESHADEYPARTPSERDWGRPGPDADASGKGSLHLDQPYPENGSVEGSLPRVNQFDDPPFEIESLRRQALEEPHEYWHLDKQSKRLFHLDDNSETPFWFRTLD